MTGKQYCVLNYLVKAFNANKIHCLYFIRMANKLAEININDNEFENVSETRNTTAEILHDSTKLC